MARRTKVLPSGGAVGEIGIHDPFELIRHLARSQGDSRKAVAELVQNSLDEQARRIVIERRREHGEVVLSVLDDGLGVLPKLPREQALTHIAKNIGHSRKRQLSFDERMRQAMLGQYGIGLLGFWSIGHELRMLSRVNDSEIWGLSLYEDSPRFTVQRYPEDLGRPGTWTEVQVRRVHRAAMGSTGASRLESYLSVELRGQLIRHGAELHLRDRLARRAAEKELVVRPSALAGEKLPGLEPLKVPGFSEPIVLELHYAGEGDPEAGRVRLACAGAIVLDDLGSSPELAHAPWSDSRLVGVIDFPHLEVPPGSRRGFVPNAAAAAMIEALRVIEAKVTERLEERAAAAAASLSHDVHRQLARLFTKATGLVPHLEWFPVARRGGALEGTDAAEGQRLPETGEEAETGEQPQPELFPPGPLASVKIRPLKLELAVEETRVLTARALDAEGRRVEEALVWTWSGEGEVSLVAEGASCEVKALAASGRARIRVEAKSQESSATAHVEVELVAEPRAKKSDAGIPPPEELNEPLQTWRSRMVNERWQINVGHPDYTALAPEGRGRLRYLAYLLSKEIISRNFAQPGIGAVLEEMVGVLAALERSGAWGARR